MWPKEWCQTSGNVGRSRVQIWESGWTTSGLRLLIPGEEGRGGDSTAGRGERNSVGVTSAGHRERQGKLRGSEWQLRLGQPWRKAGAAQKAVALAKPSCQIRRGDGEGPFSGRSASTPAQEDLASTAQRRSQCAPRSPRASVPSSGNQVLSSQRAHRPWMAALCSRSQGKTLSPALPNPVPRNLRFRPGSLKLALGAPGSARSSCELDRGLCTPS